jgi:hypothetical protein
MLDEAPRAHVPGVEAVLDPVHEPAHGADVALRDVPGELQRGVLLGQDDGLSLPGRHGDAVGDGELLDRPACFGRLVTERARDPVGDRSLIGREHVGAHRQAAQIGDRWPARRAVAS